MCGVLATSLSSGKASTGSSPHVRGFVFQPPQPHGVFGFIPACAGFCGPLREDAISSRVHPRMCGVLYLLRHDLPLVEGSSPHVRGFVEIKRPCPDGPGFIPACAGFWLALHIIVERLWVHPRMCGVLHWPHEHQSDYQGSSPHVRGFVIFLICILGQVRFIPACAGF